MGFHPGTSHSYFFNSDFWPNLNFLLEHQIKLVLISCLPTNLDMLLGGAIIMDLFFYSVYAESTSQQP